LDAEAGGDMRKTVGVTANASCARGVRAGDGSTATGVEAGAGSDLALARGQAGGWQSAKRASRPKPDCAMRAAPMPATAGAGDGDGSGPASSIDPQDATPNAIHASSERVTGRFTA
jgi:hypothetical protein